jgi:hypothetical protein
MLAISLSTAQAQVIVKDDPLLPDRRPLLPDQFNPPRSLVFVTPEDPDFVRFLGRVRPVASPSATKSAPPQGIAPIDRNDSDRDGYVEYYDGGAYVAELKKQGPLQDDPQRLRLSGVVRQRHVAKFTGYDDPHLLLRVQHADGKSALVDAGPAKSLAQLALDEGDVVEVVARPGLVNQRPALIADAITQEDITVTIVRGPSER